MTSCSFGAVRAVADIDLAALSHNLAEVRRLCPAARVMAVVKSNAYGFGIHPVLPALSAADGFAVADVEEALEIASETSDKPITVLRGFFTPDELLSCCDFNINVVVHQFEQIEMLERLSHQTLSKPIPIWFMVDVGINRLGFSHRDIATIEAAWQRLNALSYVKPLGVMSHFSCADLPTHEQNHREQQAFQALIPRLHPKPAETSLANSNGLIHFSSARTGWVRPGLALYGGLHAEGFCFKPVMRFRSVIIALRALQQGETIGYGATFTALTPMTVAVINVGYGDGYPRSGVGQKVYIAGVYCPIVGRVSMDMLTVDVTAVSPKPQLGEPVELWGVHVDVNEVAKKVNTIAYELFCQLTPRVGRNVMTWSGV